MQDKLPHIVCSVVDIGSNALLEAFVWRHGEMLRNNPLYSTSGLTSELHSSYRYSEALPQCEMIV